MPGFDSPEGKASSAEAAKALEKAPASGKSAALAELAAALGREQRYEESVRRGLEALDLAEEAKDRKGKGCCFYIVARTQQLRGATAAAQLYAAQAVVIFEALGLAAWAEPAAGLLLSTTGLQETEVQRARRSAGKALEAMQAMTERRRQSLLRLNEAKSFMNRGDHEGALGCVCDAFSLAEGEPDELGAPFSMCPANLCLSKEVRSGLMVAVDILSKNPKEKAATLLGKAKVLVLQGDVAAAKAASKEAVEVMKQQKDVAGEVAALCSLAAIQALPELGETAEAVQAADQAVQAAKSLPKSAQVAALCTSAVVQGNKSQSQAALELAAGDEMLQVEALCSLAQVQLAEQSCAEALATSEKILKIFAAAADVSGQVAAGCMTATCSCMLGEATAARAAAAEACALAKSGEDLGAEAVAQRARGTAALAANRGGEALEAAERVLRLARHFEDPTGEPWALLELARLQMAENPGQGVASAEEALAAARKASAPQAVAAATAVLARAHAARQKAVAARRAVERLQELPGRGSGALAVGRRGEGLAQLLAAQVLRGSAQAVQAAKDAQVLLSGLRDRVGEAAAHLALAEAHAALQGYEQALAAGKQAAVAFKAAHCGVGEGVALCVMAGIQLRMEDALEAEKTAKEALRVFQQIRSLSLLKRSSALVGEARARQLLAHTQLSSLQPSSARLFFDEFNCAHLEISEMASQETLEAAVATLHNMQRQRNNVKAVVMHLDGVVGPANLHSPSLLSGSFMVGLRAISIPVILAAVGKISGPSWQLVLGCDYRIASVDTDFLLPIISPPECLAELVGAAMASQLTIGSGILDAQGLQELGILNQIRPSKDETGRAASELGKRIAGFPGIACRQAMNLMTVPPVRYTTVGSYKLPDPDLMA